MRGTKNISVDLDVWEDARKIIGSESGMNMSKYIEITLRGLTRAKTSTAEDFFKDTIMELFKATEKSKKAKIVMKKNKK